jgi:TRAP-type transport system periplasmic protein
MKGCTGRCVFSVAMNKQKWDSLPKDVQATVEKINQEWVEKSGKVWDQIETEGLEFTKARAGKVALAPEE